MTKRQGKDPGMKPGTSLTKDQVSPGDVLDGILARLADGKLTPADAEAGAQSAGLKPLAQCPPAWQFDPKTKPEWSLPMVLAWIATRDLELVREFDNDYRRRVTGFRHDGKGWLLAPAPLVGLLITEWTLLESDNVFPDSAAASEVLVQSRGDLWQRLCDGKLTARAITPQDATPVEIPAFHWPRLRPMTEGDDVDRDCLYFEGAPGVEVYRDVMIPHAQLLKVFPPLGHRNTSASANECRQRLQAKIDASPDSKTISKGDFISEARSKNGLSKAAAGEVWEKTVEPYPEWKRTGPPRGERKAASVAALRKK